MFNKEKDLILKIVNLILILWLIGGFIFLYVSVVDTLMTEPTLNYEEYKLTNCHFEENDSICRDYYNSYNVTNRMMEKGSSKNIFISLGNIVLVSTALYILNKVRVKK